MSADWTAVDGRANSSPAFVALVDEVARLIRSQAHTLIAGDAESVARLVLAQLARVHGLRPSADLEALAAERHHLGFAIDSRTGTYSTESVLVKRDWYIRLMLLIGSAE
jgi:hypothetical protein